MNNEVQKGEAFIRELEQRDIIQNITNRDKVVNALNNNRYLYVGFDPSAESIHLGNFVVVNILSLCQKYNINFIPIIGGITGQIGDPSGKKAERKLIDVNIVKHNVECIKKQIAKLLNVDLIINNLDFYKNSTIIDFLRESGKYVNISYLLNKEIIKNRLESGISFTEFSYSILQATDWYHLHHDYNVDVQIGGSDQWGNITIGIDFINKKDDIPEADSPLAGFTLKLLLKSDGTKFGKSEKGAIYLSDKLVSPYTMYQFLINQSDADSQRLLNYLTNYSIEEIKEIIEKAKQDPASRYAQNKLAENIVTRVHGKEVYAKVKNLSSMIFGTNARDLTVEDINLIKNDFPMVCCPFIDNEKIVDLLTRVNIFKSKTELRTLIQQGGLSVGGKKVTDENATLKKEDTIRNKYLIVQKGKKDIYIIENIA